MVPAEETAGGRPSPPDDWDTRLAKALAHPLRVKILELLNRRVGSPRDIADELGAKLGDVGYHTRMLRDYGVVELVETRRRRGAVQHFYRATTRAVLDDEQWAQLPLAARRGFVGVALQQIAEHLVAATATGGFDRDDMHVSWTRFDLDPLGFAELADLLVDTVERTLQIQAESLERLKGSDAETVTSELVLLHFLPATEST